MVRSDVSAERVRAIGGRPIVADVTDAHALERAIYVSAADALVSLIPLSSGLGPLIVAAAERAGVVRAVFVSTTAIFSTLDTTTNPLRRVAEKAIQASSLDWTIIRPTMIYGEPGDRNLERVLRLLNRTPVVPVPPRRIAALQQPVHVEDCARTVVAALKSRPAVARSYQVAGPEPMTLRQLIRQASAALGRRPVLAPIPWPPIVGMARGYERIARHPRFRAEQLSRAAENKAFAIGPACRDLGHDPRPFAEGIAQEVALLRGML